MKIRVAFETSPKSYTYQWPDDHKVQPDIGDVVEVPANWAFPEPGRTGVVVGVGSEYDGPMQSLVRVVPSE